MPSRGHDRPSISLPRIDGYDLVAELGRGGMGVVYLARQQSLQRTVALKVIRPDRMADDVIVERFRREARAAAQLRHANIVTVYDFVHQDEVHFLVMEYVAGVPLNREVNDSGPLGIADACACIRQAALGLQHAFEQGLVHRDVKPHNLMRETATGVVKVLDFGLARLDIAGTDSGFTLTQEGTVLGTADFIAPEQIENSHDVDIRADLYSLGCTFYFLLTGQVVFPGGSMIQKLDKQRWQAPPPVERLRPSVPPDVAAVVRRLLAKHPDDRFATPRDLADELQAIHESLTVVHPTAALTVRRDDTPRETRVRPLLPPDFVGEVQRLVGPRGYVTALAVTHDGRQAAAAGLDACICHWDLDSGRLLRRWEAHAGPVHSLFLSADGQRLYSHGEDQRLRVWELASGRLVAEHELPPETGYYLLVLPGECSFVVAGRLEDGGPLRRWSLDGSGEMEPLSGHRHPVQALAASADSRYLLSAARSGTLRLWDIADSREVNRLHGHDGAVFALAIAADGRLAASAGRDRVICLWDLTAGHLLAKLHGHTANVRSVKFSADGRWLLSGGNDQTVRLWDLSTGSERHRFEGHTDSVACVALAGAERYALSGGNDQTVRVWRLPEGTSDL
jgi:WD40 repeat protein/tRNA A-37 threonylcarbamoyl transferase component Bud32